MLSYNLSSFILKIFCLIVILNIILSFFPNGKIKTTTKTVFAFLLLFLFLNFIKNNSLTLDKIDDIDYEKTVELQNNYLDYITNKKNSLFQQKIYQTAEKNGIMIKDIEITFDSSGQFLEKITVKCENKYISEKNEHIVEIDNFKKEISKNLNIGFDRIVLIDEK